jgi:hypothetical protein
VFWYASFTGGILNYPLRYEALAGALCFNLISVSIERLAVQSPQSMSRVGFQQFDVAGCEEEQEEYQCELDLQSFARQTRLRDYERDLKRNSNLDELKMRPEMRRKDPPPSMSQAVS